MFCVRRPLLLGALLGLLAAPCVRAADQPAASAPAPVVTSGKAVYDDETKEVTYTDGPRLVSGDTTITADEIRYNRATGIVTATGNFVLENGRRRLVAENGTYNTNDRTLHVHHLRLGQFPLYLSGDTVDGTFDQLVFTNATVFFRENAPYTPSIHADRVTYARGKIVRAEGMRIGLHGGHVISLPHYEQALDADFVSYVTGRLGYRGNLGVFAEAGLHLPVTPYLQLGADAGLYSSRGLMIGPSGRYHDADADGFVDGYFRSGYISDSGDRRTDILGRPVPRDRSYLEWQHRQQVGDHFTLDGEFNYWSDSEILRDFRHHEFDRTQQPDSFLEAAYTGNNYSLSAFTRLHPNRYYAVPERLPEVRFDLMPTPLALGVYQRFAASAAVLESDALGASPQLKTNRLDAYYGLERPVALAPWLSFTPVAGARVTDYTDALNGRSTYTRTIGEVGFDSHLLSSGTFDYKNPLWDIDGLRHLLEPVISYRYAPEAGKGRPYIPPIDAQVFTTYLQPLSILDRRSIDDLSALNTFRFQLNNTLQTRDPKSGSRNLVELNFAADYNIDRPAGARPLSNLYTEFALTPAPWMRLDVFSRVDAHTPSQQELNTGLTIADHDWWSVQVATHYLRHDYEQYYLNYRQRLNEVYDAYGLWRYDARFHRFDEQSYGIVQRLGQTWAVRYEVSFFDGPRRESRFSLNMEIELLKF